MTFSTGRDISLYIPVRNAARTLRAALESVERQSLQPREVFLVVDLRSEDDSVNIARDSGLRIVEQRDGRLGHARNLAIEACQTPWLASCDSDVVLEPGWLETLARHADDAIAAVGGCTLERIHTDGDRWRAVNLPHNWGPHGFDNPFMLVSEMLANAAALRSIGGYRADLQCWEDSDCSQRLRHAGYVLRYEPSAVAWHDRRDTIEQVLDLRWYYASYRQRARLESLAGLAEKLSINRAYCLQSLSQTLHSPYPQVCAAGVLLWIHHVIHDLRAALRLWPLIPPDRHAPFLRAVRNAALSGLPQPWKIALQPIETLLPRCFDDGCTRDAQRVRPEEPDHPLLGLRGFRDYLNQVHTRTTELFTEIAPDVRELVARSAMYLAGKADANAWCAMEWKSTEADRRTLRTQPLDAAWHWPSLRSRLDSLGFAGLDDYTWIEWGRSLGVERPVPRGEDICTAAGRAGAAAAERHPWSTDGPAPRMAIVPHLECFSDPLSMLRSALASARLAVIGYQMPRVFLPAVPILTARDIVARCAESGFIVRDFQTDAARTVIVVEHARSHRHSAAETHAAATASHTE